MRTQHSPASATTTRRARNASVSPRSSRSAIPSCASNPETGERGLFVNETFTSHIDGLSSAESDALLRMLYEHMTQPERVVRWRWREGDVAFWDNRATAHYAAADYGEARRVTHRVTIAGDRPFGR